MGDARLRPSKPGPVCRIRIQRTLSRRGKAASPRYKCEGSAEIQEDGREVRTWATFSDVSLHGCYVEAQATYPVGTTLHLKLEANGIRVECQASVRVTYPYLAMGISFGEMSDENRRALKELIEHDFTAAR